jgi:tRNA U34 5-methylaminomethyl-2-thiouridine-forming methyltransferase MnmC
VQNIQLIQTDDGSSSLLNVALNETYHSKHGAIQESNHVFIKNGLQFFVENNRPASVSIFEVGFGTGLNALLALLFSIEKNVQIDYASIEAFPIDTETAHQLNYPSLLSGNQLKNYFDQLHQAEWNKKIKITDNFSFQKVKATIQDFDFQSNQFNIIFFDAFAPAKQPEMWELPILEKVISSLKQSGVFVTYCAQGQLKRNLKSVGLVVEALPGPPGKREMVRAYRK